MSACSKAACYAVLASLSERYPPLEGRSPTCYSPVCHSTHPLRDFRVRLACVRHAASVDSEPGSNSHVKFVRLRASALRRDSLTRGRCIGSALFNPYLCLVVHRQLPPHGLKRRSIDFAAPLADTLSDFALASAPCDASAGASS